MQPYPTLQQPLPSQEKKSTEKQVQQDENQVFGKLATSDIPCFAVFILTLSIIICYVIAVALGHAQTFPFCSIAETATQYPEYIIFRIGAIVSCPLIFFCFLFKYWLLSHQLRLVTMFQKHACRCIPVIGFLTAITFAVSTATLSDGNDMNNELHDICVFAAFFLCHINFGIILYTLYLIRFASGSKVISDKTYYTKVFLYLLNCCAASGLFICAIYQFLPDVLTNMFEYFGAFLLIAQIYTFTWDFKQLDLGLEGDADDNGYNVQSQQSIQSPYVQEFEMAHQQMKQQQLQYYAHQQQQPFIQYNQAIEQQPQYYQVQPGYYVQAAQ